MERTELRALVRATGSAMEKGEWMMLCDPTWRPEERKRARALLGRLHHTQPKPRQGWLCLPTGGTGGVVRFARHDERTLVAAVRGFCAHFNLRRVNAVGVLPPHHISGLMARVRCVATGGEYVDWNWKDLEAGRRPVIKGGPWVISLVPTQLQRLLQSRTSIAWLRRFEIVFLGGGPVWTELAEQAAKARLRISLSYGLTETAAMVAALRPREFAAGERSCGRTLPHARLRIGRGGVVRISGRSLFRGYAGELRGVAEFSTGDLGSIDASGRVHILGRRDAVIITGGKKVHPATVEAALRATGVFPDVAVIGLPDAEWGEVVVACHPAGPGAKLKPPPLPDLPAYQRPKRLIAIKPWPRNAQGKLDRARLKAAAGNQGEVSKPTLSF